MNLKKLLPELAQAIVEMGLDTDPKPLMGECMPKIKSGTDAFILAPEDSGKTTTLVIGVIQQLKKPEGDVPRAIVLVKSKEDAQQVVDLFSELGKYTKLRYFQVFDQGVIQYQKDTIYEGLDVLIGTPKRINELMSITGIPLTGIKLLVVDDAEIFYSSRNYPVIYRLGEACPKAQVLIFANYWIDNFEILSENRMKGPVVIELDEEI